MAALPSFAMQPSPDHTLVGRLTDAVRAGRIRYVLTSGAGGFGDGRTGSRDVMSAVQQTCSPVSGVSGLYDCQGHEAALAASGA